MKKIFTLLTMALLAVGASAQTATDPYLDIAQYETLDDIDLKNCTKLYSYNETKKVLVVSAYAVQQSSVDNQDEGKIGLGWFSYSASNSAGTSWNATGDFKGSAFYGTLSSGSASDRGLNTKNHYSFFVTNCTKVSALIHSKSKNRTVTMDVYPVTFASNGDVTRGEKAGSASDNTNTVAMVSVDELDASVIYEVEFYSSDNDGGHLYEVAFYQPNDEQPQAVKPVFLLTKTELYPGEESQIHIEGSEGLEGMIMQNLNYNMEIITVTGDGGIIANKPGTTTIRFTTDAVEGKYLEGSAELEITVKDYPEEIDYPTSVGGVTLKSIDDAGQVVFATVKIHENKDAVNAIKIGKSFTNTDDNNYYVVLTVNGGFKTNDVITIAGVYSNDNDKNASISFYTDPNGTPIWTTKNFINGKMEAGEPESQTFTLKSNTDKLYLGRTPGLSNATTTYITLLKVVRGEAVVSHDPTTWDFTQELSSADASNLEADAIWDFDAENGYWINTDALAERNVYTALVANGVELDIAKGLTFARDNSEGLAAEGVRIAPAKYLAVNGSSNIINLDVLAKDDVIRLRFKGAGETERSLTPANATVTEGSLTTEDTEVHEVALKTTEDGSVTFKTTNGFQFLAITINAVLPEYTGISVINAETEGAADAPVYNLSGQRVDENYRGVVIKNGKKVVK